MSDEDALLAAIAAHPDEDTPRLMYADWLDEHGRPVRAEFIRVQIEIARIESLPRRELNRYVNLYKRNQELIDTHRAELLGPLAVLPAETRIEFRRGFVAEITLHLNDLCERYDEVAATLPLPRVIIAGNVRYATGALGFLWDVAHYAGCEDVVAVIRTTPSRDEMRHDAHMEPFDWRVWPRLDELDISGCRLGDAYTAEMLRGSSFPVLADLDLSGNDLTDTAVDSLLSTGLPTQLKRLVLSGNGISDIGAVALAERWPTGAGDRLENLNLRFTNIGQVGQAALLRRFGGRVDLF